ncbi:MAG: diguanylate cyclase [Alteromonadaceae bacterium]|nr:diguanylate cyclase [Alteromonadaceae bacterium]MBH84955.1 diguanylate cyclase [Alteromonadaceae bacterium]|tara:strand:- start:4414 stop:8166 length:3753 start_codon:yes stop_codon:yes gene_type:complete
MERRASTRQPIKLAAQLYLTDDQSWPCQIADFCAEGLFIRFSGDTAKRVRGALSEAHRPDDLLIRFRSADGASRHDMHVQVARLMDGAMGVYFTRESPAALNAMLQQLGSSANQERSHLKPPSERVQFVLHQCAKTVIQHIEQLMEPCFDGMVSTLSEAAQHAPSDQLANELLDASGQLASRQRAIWHQMMIALESPLKPERKGAPGSELSLVDKSEFEDWLTIKVMVTKADTLYRGELLQLRMRLDKLGVGNATGHHNPLGPALICEAFHNGLQHFKASRDVEKICLKVFDKLVLQQLESLYTSLNQILIRQGVLPDLDLSRYLSDRTPRKEPEKPTVKAAPASPAKAPEPVLPASARHGGVKPGGTPSPDTFRSHSQSAQTAFATVRNLLSTLSTRRKEAGVSAPAPYLPDARQLSAGEFQRELQSMQQSATEASAASDQPLRERVVEQVRDASNAALDEAQQETVDVVDQFFRSVVDSPRLNDAVRQQMRHLEVPVLKVVLRDRAFFDDQSSPVRGVMNRMAQLGIKGGRVNPVIQRRMDEMVQRITREFDQDTAVFESVRGELDTLIERQNLVYRRNVERVSAAAEGAQKVAEAKKAVTDVLDQRLGGRQVPKPVLSLLNGGWRDLLSLTWIRQGPDSQLWQDYLSVLDSLMAFADNEGASINLPELLRMIQDGLASISSNHLPSAQIRDELKSFLVKGPGAEVERVDVPREAAPVQTPEDKATERQLRSLQRWTARAQRLSVGDWLRNQDNPNEPYYVRLVWIARAFSRFVFVNHQGMRVVELTLEQLAHQLKQGILVPDESYERPLVDDSIDRMVKQVYDQLSWVSTHDELTGLLARREFERVLEQHLTRPDEQALSLVKIDLRQFRLLNDTAGFKSGDDALARVAETLRQHVAPELPLARLDGNEFAFLFPAEGCEAAVKVVIAGIEALEFEYNGRHYRFSACAGIAPNEPALVTAERWLKAADASCKSAKQLGNGRVVTYTMNAQVQAQQEQIAAKVAGLGNFDEDQVLLRGQKLIPLHADANMGTQYEILISMYDDAGNLITAAEFVRMAERYNRMQAVDRWVVGRMLDALRDSESAARKLGGVCINLSGYSLNDASLLEFIYEKLSQKNAPIERLWFEITEAAAIHNLQEVADFMIEMKELGCRFCLGNFGSGPTSYEYMRSLPVDLIKLDGAFTRHIVSNEADRAMVRSMVDMAHYTKREVIASQVEDRATLDMLRSLGVDYAQGYVIEKPQLLNTILS